MSKIFIQVSSGEQEQDTDVKDNYFGKIRLGEVRSGKVR